MTPKSVEEVAREITSRREYCGYDHDRGNSCCITNDSAQALLVAQALRAARREALEEASWQCERTANSLAAWMRRLPVGSNERRDKSRSAGDFYAAAQGIRALASYDGEKK